MGCIKQETIAMVLDYETEGYVGPTFSIVRISTDCAYITSGRLASLSNSPSHELPLKETSK